MAPPPESSAPPANTEKDRCFLLGPTALVVQAIMGALVISSLVVKRQLERRKRRWRVWILDVGKQLAGQAVIHALNLLISQLVAHAGQQNPCSLYFLNILIDTTIGTAIIWITLKWYTTLFARRYGPEAYTTGHYGHPPQWKIWAQQLQPYILAAVTMKLVVLVPLTLPGISDVLISFAHSILSVFSLDAQVIFVLAVFPTIMNVFQFCVVDQVIKAGKNAEQKTGHDSDYDLDDEESVSYRPLATEESFASIGNGSANAGYSARRRGSSARASMTGSRTSSVAGSAPPSPLLTAANTRLMNDYQRSEGKVGSLRLSGVGGEGAWNAGLNSDGSSSSTASRLRRSDAPSPDDGVVLFAAEPEEVPLTAMRSEK